MSSKQKTAVDGSLPLMEDHEQGKAVGRRIQEARLEQGGMTQRELADLLDVSERSLQGYEMGEVIPFKHMPLLSRLLQKPVYWFLHGEEEPTEMIRKEYLRLLESIDQHLAVIRTLLEDK